MDTLERVENKLNEKELTELYYTLEQSKNNIEKFKKKLTSAATLDCQSVNILIYKIYLY